MRGCMLLVVCLVLLAALAGAAPSRETDKQLLKRLLQVLKNQKEVDARSDENDTDPKAGSTEEVDEDKEKGIEIVEKHDDKGNLQMVTSFDSKNGFIIAYTVADKTCHISAGTKPSDEEKRKREQSGEEETETLKDTALSLNDPDLVPEQMKKYCGGSDKPLHWATDAGEDAKEKRCVVSIRVCIRWWGRWRCWRRCK